MKYAKIKPECQDKQLPNGWYLVANELYTMSEATKYAIPAEYYDEVELSPKQVFFSFGARFASER